VGNDSEMNLLEMSQKDTDISELTKNDEDGGADPRIETCQ